ncbi:glutathione S-transferase family protein [Pelagimonas varians]|uniref:Glutathione S-transferase GST-6.0 n=1 Tax=Pelagimonas varians TaxID=696760 RepID=A0A238KDM8_9RHOB|nr:glutathione S-transferase [Pelagimonas varians]PYG29869.1 glutathione S-transferase [Pelagimonas varians]SMX40928.1 Glutathione S-transferase GST-6.0 [Pelagimonas varians]
MKIYEFRGFPNPARIRIALAEKDMLDQAEFISVNVPDGEHQSDAFRAKNPSATVPMLELEDGTCISECTAITEYLDHLDGSPTLTGSTPRQRARIHMMQRRAEAGLLDAVATYFHHATPGLGPDVEGYQCPDWGNHQKETALTGMRYLDGVLENQPWLAGDDFSMADITAFAGLIFAGFAQLGVPDSCANLRNWQDRMAQRPSVAALG